MNPYLKLAIVIVIYLALGWKVLLTAGRNIIHGEIFDENFLMTVATIGALCVGEYEEAILVMLLYRVGEFLQDKAVDKSRKSISDLMDIRPDYANIEQNGEWIKTDPASVAVGTTIFVKPGERIPLDGMVLEGNSRVDTAALTGESLPVDVSEGSEVHSGTINLDGVLRIRTTATSEDSTASRILDLVENAAASRANSEKFITKFARYYTPIVCGLAVLLAVIPPLLFHGVWADWIHRALSFLVVSCPCALVISIPLGFFGGIGGASAKGILIKGGNYLEALSKADAIAFDKTGTLTKGVFKVVAVHPDGISEAELLELATLAESFSNHPIARSLADEYGKHVDKARVHDAKETLGLGITSVVDGRTVSCGSRKYMETLGLEYEDCEVPGSNVHVAVDGVYAGHIVISDEIKDEAAQALKELKELGVGRLALLTGDKEAMAKSVAEELPDLTEYHAELLPQDKVEITKGIMKELPAGRKMAFVGDGINDAPVLTVADVGIAMGGMGSAAAVEAADIVLMNDKPTDISLAVRIARKTMGIIKQNIIFSIGVKIVVLILAAFGISSMILASFADTGVCLLAILNSMRALRIK
ncbi:MAG: cadmium-translocating P-type ATPase [Firmicutes bacterium]|nr:cadmium-translocating P-type ATPase [Bacillota bacterium]